MSGARRTGKQPSPRPSPKGRGEDATEFPAAEPGKLVAEIAFLGARSVFLIAENPSLTPASPFLTAEFPFLTQNVDSRPAKPCSDWREAFSESENPFAECRIRFSDRRNRSAGSERPLLFREANSAARKGFRALRKRFAAARKPSVAHVALSPPDAPGLPRIAFLVSSSTKRGLSLRNPVSRGPAESRGRADRYSGRRSHWPDQPSPPAPLPKGEGRTAKMSVLCSPFPWGEGPGVRAVERTYSPKSNRPGNAPSSSSRRCFIGSPPA